MAGGGKYDKDNIFAKIIKGDAPCFKIFETEHSLAFLDAFPMAEGHSILVPKATGFQDMVDLPVDTAAEFLADLPRLVKAVKKVSDDRWPKISKRRMLARAEWP